MRPPASPTGWPRAGFHRARQPPQSYDMRQVIRALADEDNFFELQPDFARNILTGYCRLNGRTVGVVANQPKVGAGCLDVDASDKAARFIRRCDSFNTAFDPGGRARLFARHRAGACGHHSARGENAVRLQRGHRAQGDSDHP